MIASFIERAEGRIPHALRREYTLAEGAKPYINIFVGIFGAGTIITAALGKIDAAIAFYTMTTVSAGAGAIRNEISNRRNKKPSTRLIIR